MPGRTTLWQKHRASGTLRRSRLRYSRDAAEAQRVHLARLVPCVPGTLRDAADSRECLKGTLNALGDSLAKMPRRLSPGAERALLPTSRAKDGERALVPMALLYVYQHSE